MKTYHDTRFTITDLYIRPADLLTMLTGKELVKAMPLCAEVSLAGSRHWMQAEQTPIDPAVLAGAIREYEARS